jgi:hypothetical protein
LFKNPAALVPSLEIFLSATLSPVFERVYVGRDLFSGIIGLRVPEVVRIVGLGTDEGP